MRRTRLLCAIALSLWASVPAGSQSPTGALPAELRAHVKGERFSIVTSIRGLPIGVRDALQKLWRSPSLDIADPGAEFPIAIRTLVAAGCSTDHHCLIYYERGGGTRTWRVALFHWTPAATRFEWGAAAPGGLATIEDVRNAILSGAIKGETALW